MKHRVGFISANIHRSLDGGRVANYAQWRTKADFEAMLADPACQEHMKAEADLADSFDPVLYTVSSVHGDYAFGPLLECGCVRRSHPDGGRWPFRAGRPWTAGTQIGGTACRARVCQYVYVSGVAGP